MTVTDLIELLSVLPGDLDVMTDDREGGRIPAALAEVSDYHGTLPRHVVIR